MTMAYLTLSTLRWKNRIEVENIWHFAKEKKNKWPWKADYISVNQIIDS